MKKFKINDSYTTFVIDETDIENQKEFLVELMIMFL